MALITPPSAFSLLLFMLGVTKLGYPEILMQCWKTWDISIRAPEVIEHEMKKNAVRKLQAHVSSETINHEETVLRVQIDEGKNREVAVTEQVSAPVFDYRGITAALPQHNRRPTRAPRGPVIRYATTWQQSA
eukprot:scaffold37189_cov31-Tisochrysis_lutea.AAC.6